MKTYIFICIMIGTLLACETTRQPVSNYKAIEYFILNPAIRMMEIDPLGHFYIVNDEERLSRFDTTGQLLHHVVNNNLGSIHSFDPGNPFKILVFYRDQQTILLYDNTLSEIQRIRLEQWELHDVTAACLAADNAIWVFDGTTKALIKLDENGNAILTSDPFDILAPPSARPDFLFDADHFILAKETGKSIAVFNDFGNYLHPLHDVGEFFSVTNNMIVYPAGNNLRLYSLSDPDNSTIMPFNYAWTDQRPYFTIGNVYVADQKGIYALQPVP